MRDRYFAPPPLSSFSFSLILFQFSLTLFVLLHPFSFFYAPSVLLSLSFPSFRSSRPSFRISSSFSLFSFSYPFSFFSARSASFLFPSFSFLARDINCQVDNLLNFGGSPPLIPRRFSFSLSLSPSVSPCVLPFLPYLFLFLGSSVLSFLCLFLSMSLLVLSVLSLSPFS